MRGSPVVRTLVVLVSLLVAAMAIRGLSQPPTKVERPDTGSAAETSDTLETPFFMSFSAQPETVELECSGEKFTFRAQGPELAGILPLAGEHPTIFLTVTWRDGSEVPRFTKLTLEPPGLPTLNRTFDAIGEISDVWEPHLHQ